MSATLSAMRRTASASQDDVEEEIFVDGQQIVLDGISYDEYVAINDMLDERGLRFAYLDGTLEIMSPGNRHESVKTALARLLELYALQMGIPIYGLGSTTTRKKRKKVGVEPDECYYVGASHRRYARMKRPYDLAIEVVQSHGMRKIEIYRRLGVREVWVVEKGTITINALWGERYVVRPKSKLFPDLDLALLAEYAHLDFEEQDDAVRAWWALLRRE